MKPREAVQYILERVDGNAEHLLGEADAFVDTHDQAFSLAVLEQYGEVNLGEPQVVLSEGWVSVLKQLACNALYQAVAAEFATREASDSDG